jgi:hypothetical protein
VSVYWGAVATFVTGHWDAVATFVTGHWDAVATFVTGLMAVGAAYWTIKRTERAARMEATQRVRAVGARAVAVLEVAQERLKERGSDTSDVLPWNAFSALSADIGLLGIDPTRLFFFIERLARTAEHFAKNNNGRPSNEQMKDLLEAIERLLPMCRRAADRVG